MKRHLRQEVRLLFVAVACVATFSNARGEAAQPLPWVEGSTTLAVLPDTERYSDDYPQYFQAQTKWIAENYKRRNIAYVMHLGDITQHNAAPEWELASRCFGMLEGHVPYVLVPGNHDYSEGRKTLLNEYFPVSEIQTWSTFGGVHKNGRLENSYHLFRIGDCDWIALGLEFGPRDDVVRWANEVLDHHRDRLAILVTHAYLFRDNTRYDHLRGSQRASPHGWGNDGEELWQKLVRRHPNMMILISGHVSTGGLGYLASEGDYGNTVHQMMVDYEKLRGGGQAYMRLLEFLPDGKTVQVRTYSPAVNRTRHSKLEEFTFELKPATRDTPKPVNAVPSVPLSKAPIHRYSFDGFGRAGARIRDSVGNAHGVLRPERSASSLDGRGRLTLTENGHVLLPARLLGGLEDVSFEVWFTPTADTYNWNSVVRFGDSEDWLVYVFRTLTVHRAEIAVRRHNEDIQRTVPVKAGEPMHVVVTYDHDGADGKPLLAYYRNGKQFGTLQTDLQLGDVDDTGNTIGPFAGSFDELRIYDYSLTPAEVASSFEAGPTKIHLAERGRN